MRRLAATALMVLAGAATPPGERLVTGDGVTTVRIGKIVRRMRVDPGAPALPLITTEWQRAAGLRAGRYSIGYNVGPERITGETGMGWMTFADGRSIRQWIGFTDRRYAAGVDGVVGPDGVPDRVVRFVLGPHRRGERTARLPFAVQEGLAGEWSDRFATVKVGGIPMRLRFDPHHPFTMATAGAGIRIAEAQGGMVGGQPFITEIVFGIARPVRRMTLARPLVVGPLSLDRLGVRTNDHGNASTIADADAPPDPDEIVVVGRRRTDWHRDVLSLGADVLGRCSELVFDKRAREIRLTCA